MTNPREWSLGKIVGVIIFLVVIGSIVVYSIRSSPKKINNISTVKVDRLIVKKAETGKLNVGNAEIKQAEIGKAKVKKEKVKRQEVKRQQLLCSSSQICRNKPHIAQSPLCRNECSYNNQRRCAPGCLTNNQYQVCGNYDSDSCLEWSHAYSCLEGQVCQGGECVPRCISHYNTVCYDNDVYWYNSCGVREEKYKECGSDTWESNYRCFGNWVQREKNERGCAGSSCYSHSQWENYQNCSDTGMICRNGQCAYNCLDECYYAGQKRCVIGFENQYQVCGNYDSDSCLEWSHAYSCLEGQVCQGGECVPRCISHYNTVCYDNDVYWYNSCGVREEKYKECGSDTWSDWSANYCFGNNIYHMRIHYDKGCLDGQCYSNSYEDKQLVKQCEANETCQSGECVCASCGSGGPGPDPP